MAKYPGYTTPNLIVAVLNMAHIGAFIACADPFKCRIYNHLEVKGYWIDPACRCGLHSGCSICIKKHKRIKW
jgi:hypothetical protein